MKELIKWVGIIALIIIAGPTIAALFSAIVTRAQITSQQNQNSAAFNGTLNGLLGQAGNQLLSAFKLGQSSGSKGGGGVSGRSTPVAVSAPGSKNTATVYDPWTAGLYVDPSQVNFQPIGTAFNDPFASDNIQDPPISAPTVDLGSTVFTPANQSQDLSNLFSGINFTDPVPVFDPGSIG